ncbi:hypothetical protein FLLO111716_08510 [Flavobacterium longum]|uniref:hypothetical protein n=1 Tax=Flavobacterium longum TaxID=1299340 RepID=UPI0039E8A302
MSSLAFNRILIGAVVLMAMACSSEDEQSSAEISPLQTTSQGGVLVKQMINHWYSDGFWLHDYPFDFIYDGNKLLRIINPDGGSVDFTYTGNLITSIKERRELLESSAQYEYSLSYDMYHRLIKCLKTSNYGADYRMFYNYVADGIVDRHTYRYEGNYFYYSFDRFSFTEGDQNTLLPEGTIINYDEMNSPLKNITGFDKIMLAYRVEYFVGGGSQMLWGNKENLLSQNNPETGQALKTFEYTYNQDNYPTEMTVKDSLIRYKFTCVY